MPKSKLRGQMCNFFKVLPQGLKLPKAQSCFTKQGKNTYFKDPTDEDGDTGIDDSIGVSASLGGEISLGGKKSQELNSDNTRGTTVGKAIEACSGGIGNSLVASYACMNSIYGSSCKGEKTSVAERYLVKSFEESGEVFLGKAGK
nr:hypothetical protein [Tanacetum cinerariifolium]